MKIFTVKSNGKTYNVKANDAQQAVKFVKMLCKDANDYVITIGGDPKKAVKTKEEAIREAKLWQKVVGKNVLCEVMYSPEDYSDDKVVWKAYGMLDSARDSVKDAASAREVIQQLIDDEASATAAYNIAIKNLTGELDERSIGVLRAIRDDEERHSENLFAIMSGNVTEKNLQDSSTKDDRLDITRLLKRAIEYADADNYQAVANVCSNIISSLKGMREAK